METKELISEIEKINSKLGSILADITELRRNLTKVVNDKKEENERVG